MYCVRIHTCQIGKLNRVLCFSSSFFLYALSSSKSSWNCEGWKYTQTHHPTKILSYLNERMRPIRFTFVVKQFSSFFFHFSFPFEFFRCRAFFSNFFFFHFTQLMAQLGVKFCVQNVLYSLIQDEYIFFLTKLFRNSWVFFVFFFKQMQNSFCGLLSRLAPA